MSKPRVFLTGGDGIGWAVDEDLRLVRQALAGIVELVDVHECEVVHSVWWEGLMMMPVEELEGKRIVCHVPGEPFRYLSVPRHRYAMDLVGRWVTRTAQAQRQLAGIGIASDTVPYLVDTDTFKSLPRTDATVRSLIAEWDLPTDRYLIGSFQRDTEGSDLSTPKRVKGPDVLLEIFAGLQRQGLDFHVVLAGPRRHWLRHRLSREGIPYTYVGHPVEQDDMEINTLSRSILNALYNVIDLYVVASRSEGGPHAIVEAAATGCKVIGTPVGTALDLLDRESIFKSPDQAAEIISEDIRSDFLAATRSVYYQKVTTNHTPRSAVARLEALYARPDTIPRFTRDIAGRSWWALANNDTPPTGNGKRTRRRSPTVSLWHTFFKPPYGGGNQFMLALRKGLLDRGVDVRHNELTDNVDAHVLNSIHFDVDRFLEFSRSHRINVIHRIDGPIHLIRGFDREKDDLCFELNDRFASATVLQSAWTYQRIVEMGYRPVSPTVVHNAVDPDIFHARDRIPLDRRGKIRLISTSWSNNPRKGGPTYKWLEENLDWDRFEYTFVGNVSEQLDRVHRIDPVPSEELGGLLREHHIYITASRNDPCSNALIEALACGLPALYFNDGGHPELVGMGGLPFSGNEEIIPALDRLVDNYESFQNLIVVPRLEDVAGKYLAIIEDVIR